MARVEAGIAANSFKSSASLVQVRVFKGTVLEIAMLTVPVQWRRETRRTKGQLW